MRARAERLDRPACTAPAHIPSQRPWCQGVISCSRPDSRNMPITLYHTVLSPPSRGALLVARTLGVDVDIKLIDLVGGDHRKPAYLKINPEHTVPSLDDNGLIIWDSHVIAMYLANRYGKDDSLYPRDPQKRVLVDQRLLFNATTMFPRMKAVCFPVFFLGANTVSKETKDAVYEALGFLESFLEPTGWVAGDGFTIADCSCVASVSTLNSMDFDLSKYKNVNAWVKRCEARIPDYQEVNQTGVDAFKEAYLPRLLSGQA